MHRQGLREDPAVVAEFRNRVLRVSQLVMGGAMALGVVFIVLGFLVKSYPVPSTVLGLVLYVGAAAVFGYLDPATLGQGIIIKIIIIVALAKSVQAAITYQRWMNTAATIDVPAPA